MICTSNKDNFLPLPRMKKVTIKVDYNNKEYVSIKKEMTEEATEKLKESVEHIARGKGDFFKISVDGNSVTFFPKEVLRNSIITFIAED